MTKKYKEVKVTKENLESLKVSNYVRVNDWQWGLRVVGVSKNFIVLHNNKGEYSVVEKREGKIDHLSIRKKGIFHCGSSLACPEGYMDFKDNEWVQKYLDMFESGKAKLFDATTIPISRMWVK